VGDNFPNVPTHNPATPPWEDASGVQS
jgi:hypothetical protein